MFPDYSTNDLYWNPWGDSPDRRVHIIGLYKNDFVGKPAVKGCVLMVGCVTRDGPNWEAWDCRESNKFQTTSRSLGKRSSLKEAKKLVEDAFKPTVPDAPEG